MKNPRVLKLADQIKQITAQMLERRIKDPRLGFVTVTDVKLTGDTREATIYYTVLGEDADVASTQAALDSAKGLIRSTIGKQLGLRFAPSLAFMPDAMPENARHIEDLLARTQYEDAQRAAAAAGAQYAAGEDPYRKPHQDDADEEPASVEDRSDDAR
ncbi:30S ribosome-binding factor RbfA [Propioniferax innocua]|uniref:Ribosome-binding factor A n=1 Tax=Propioniferax innocua TaxID=1753 RepID=A0A542ZAF5_9ACTN|nr:30S ribosome-binding factor RbfA [Propioniferax innocua]TQL57314.1 ribosome-binding factor A [Propioniferax innocua]